MPKVPFIFCQFLKPVLTFLVSFAEKINEKTLQEIFFYSDLNPIKSWPECNRRLEYLKSALAPLSSAFESSSSPGQMCRLGFWEAEGRIEENSFFFRWRGFIKTTNLTFFLGKRKNKVLVRGKGIRSTLPFLQTMVLHEDACSHMFI